MGRKVWVPVVSGPLAPYRGGVRVVVDGLGRTRPRRAADRLYQFDQLSRWLAARGAWRGRADRRAGRAVRRGAARGGRGVVGRPAQRGAAGGVSAGLGSGAAAGAGLPRTGRWRSCSPTTAATCRSSAGCRSTRCSTRMCRRRGCSCRSGRPGTGLAWTGSPRRDVSSFLARECPKRSVSGARDLVCALRSLLRYLHLAGLIKTPLVWAVPSVADLRDRTLPRGLEPAAVRRLLASCDRRRLVGRRDFRDPAAVVAAGVAGRRGRRDHAWTTSTGGPGCCWSTARAAARTCCRCRPMSARRWCPIFAAARGASAGRCSCG